MAGEATVANAYSPDTTIQSLLATTQFNWIESGKMFDNIHEATPELQWFMSGERYKVINGGERISVGIVHEKNATAKSYSGYEQLDVTPSEGMTRAYLLPKQYSVTVSISGDEQTANRGEEAQVDLLMAKQRQAENSIADAISTGIHEDGTGNDSKNITGLQAMVDTTPATTVYAAIDPATNTAWRNNANASVGAAATELLSNLRTYYNDAAQGKGALSSEPDYILTTQTVNEALEALIFPQFQFRGSGGRNSNEANAGISTDGFYYKNAQVQWSTYVTSGYLYILNGAHTWMVVYRGRDFKASGPLQKPVNQDAMLNQILYKGNIITNARRKLSVLAGIS